MQDSAATGSPTTDPGSTCKAVPGPICAVDLFCGAGGSSLGARQAGVKVAAAFDLWNLARKTYKDNVPEARVFGGRLENRNARDVARLLGPVQLLLASPECTNHTCAKGGGTRDEASRATAFQVVKFARALKPRWIVVENVVHMRTWKRFDQWKGRLKRMGYHISEQVLNSADFGVPQSRRRLFILCDREKDPPRIRPGKLKRRNAGSILNLNGKYRYSPLFKTGRAEPTLARARRAMDKLGPEMNFLIVYYGSDAAGGWQRLEAPLRTITTLDRFAFVRPGEEGHVMRMLQPEELKKAMGFPADFKMKRGCRRDRIRLLGNGVCPPVMRAIVRALTGLRRARKPVTRSGPVVMKTGQPAQRTVAVPAQETVCA